MASEDAVGIIDLYQRKALDWIESRARTRLIEKPWLDCFRALLPARSSISGAGVDLLSSAVEMHLNAVTVELDLMKPLIPLRGLGLQRG